MTTVTTATPPSGFVHLVAGFDGSAPASRALDAAVVGSIAVSLARHSPVPLVIVP